MCFTAFSIKYLAAVQCATTVPRRVFHAKPYVEDEKQIYISSHDDDPFRRTHASDGIIGRNSTATSIPDIND